MKIAREIDIQQPVHALRLHPNDRMTVIDVSNVVRVYSLEDMTLVDGFRSNVEPAVPYVNNSAVSPKGEYIVLYRPPKKELLLFDVEHKKLAHTIKAHQAGTESVVFSPDGSAFLSGGIDGRIHMWSVSSGKRTDTFPHHTDAVNVVAFSPDSHMVATSGYDRIIKVSNRSFRNNQYRLISHKEIPTTLTFLSQQRLLSTDKEGTILIWDIHDAKVIKRLEKFPTQISAVAISQDEQFLFVCGMQGDIGLYDLKVERQLKANYLHTHSGITSVLYHDKERELICGLANGKIVIYDFAAEAEQFAENLEQKAFMECYAMLEENPMLAYDPKSEALEKVFLTYYEAAKKLLKQEQTQKATALMTPFQSSSAKRLLIQKLFNDFKHYKRFVEAAKMGKFAVAYGIAEQYNDLKQTAIYESMEKKWHEILKSARKLPVNKLYKERLRELFKPYVGVPSKSLVMNTIQSEGKTVQLFQKMIGNHEYAEALKLIEGHPFLKNMEEYALLQKVGDRLEVLMEEAFHEGKYPEAVNYSDEVSCFPEKAARAKEIRNRANAYATAMSYYAEKKIAEVYNIIEHYPFLAEAEIGENVEKIFKEALLKAEQHATQGDVAAIKKAMAPFMRIRSKIPSIIHIIQVAYLGQLEQLCIKGAQLFQKGVENYMGYFGYDEMLDDELSQFEGVCSVTAERQVEAKKYEASPEHLPDTLV